MARAKKTCGVYEYLDSIGVLETGSGTDIEQAKKQYWNIIRREWKRQKRKECKSYTLLFTPSELKPILIRAKSATGGVTSYIKQAAIAYTTNTVVIDKLTIGTIRQAIVLHYTSVQQLEMERLVPNKATQKMKDEIQIIEALIFDFIKKIGK